MSTLVLSLALALVVGIALGVGFVRWQRDAAVARWQASVDSLSRVQAARDSLYFEREREHAARKQALADAQAAARRWQARYAAVKAAAPILPALPDTGMVPVAAVRQIVASYMAHIAALEQTADSTIAAKDDVIGRYDRLLVDRTNDFVAERVARQNWERKAKSAPTRRERPKVLGVRVPETVFAAGAQVGAGWCTTPLGLQSCSYAGGGLTAGLKLSF